MRGLAPTPRFPEFTDTESLHIRIPALPFLVLLPRAMPELGNRIGGVAGGTEHGMQFPYNTLAQEIFQKSDFSPAPELSHCGIFIRFRREDANFLLRGLAVDQ